VTSSGRTNQSAEAGGDPEFGGGPLIPAGTTTSCKRPVQRAKDATVNHGIVPLEIDLAYARDQRRWSWAGPDAFGFSIFSLI
jgi:hypothetical protein